MKNTSMHIGDCILCGSRVMDTSEFYETGEGYCHEFCMDHMNRAR